MVRGAQNVQFRLACRRAALASRHGNTDGAASRITRDRRLVRGYSCGRPSSLLASNQWLPRDRVGIMSPVAHISDTVTLWRPTGPEELALVEASGWREWPPRLPGQPIFYPVLNEDYAA